MKDSYKILAFLVSLTAISFAFKLLLIRDNNIMFMFDQARDAKLSRQIIENRDLKIFGPTASGSNDSLYHGVLYYYLIGPVYTLSNGNPFIVAVFLSMLISLSTISSYLFAKVYTNNRSIAVVVAFFGATSASSILASGWLSNPVLLFVTVPLFYYFLFRTIANPGYKNLAYSIIAAGLCSQFFLFTAYMWLILFFLYCYFMFTKKLSYSFKSIFGLLFVFLLTMGSMILAELLQISRGILKLGNVGEISSSIYDVVTAVETVISVLLRHVNESFLPMLPLFSILIAGFGIYNSAKLSNRFQKLFLIMFVSGPIIFLSIQARNSYHTLLGFQPIILTLVINGLSHLFPKLKLKHYLGLAAIIVISQIGLVRNYITANDSMYALQKGVVLRDQIDLIDQTYKIANGSPFSISTFTNPYLYNVTWDYLYDWYGKSKYGYVPLFKGVDQSVQFGVSLRQSDLFLPLHFAIVEPDTGLDEKKALELYPQFAIYPNATPTATMNFHRLKLVEFN